MRPQRIHSAGYTLLEVLMAIGAGYVVMAAICATLENTARIQSNARAMNQMMQTRNGFFLAIGSNTAWKNTIMAKINSTGMACLANSSPCTGDGTPGGAPISGRSFALYDSNNVMLFDATNAANGLTTSGTPCNSFSLPNGPAGKKGNDSCPFRFDLKWSANCTPGNCTNPLVNVSAALLYSGTNNNLINGSSAIFAFRSFPVIGFLSSRLPSAHPNAKPQ